MNRRRALAALATLTAGRIATAFSLHRWSRGIVIGVQFGHLSIDVGEVPPEHAIQLCSLVGSCLSQVALLTRILCKVIKFDMVVFKESNQLHVTQQQGRLRTVGCLIVRKVKDQLGPRSLDCSLPLVAQQCGKTAAFNLLRDGIRRNAGQFAECGQQVIPDNSRVAPGVGGQSGTTDNPRNPNPSLPDATLATSQRSTTATTTSGTVV